MTLPAASSRDRVGWFNWVDPRFPGPGRPYFSRLTRWDAVGRIQRRARAFRQHRISWGSLSFRRLHFLLRTRRLLRRLLRRFVHPPAQSICQRSGGLRRFRHDSLEQRTPAVDFRRRDDLENLERPKHRHELVELLQALEIAATKGGNDADLLFEGHRVVGRLRGDAFVLEQQAGASIALISSSFARARFDRIASSTFSTSSFASRIRVISEMKWALS